LCQITLLLTCQRLGLLTVSMYNSQLLYRAFFLIFGLYLLMGQQSMVEAAGMTCFLDWNYSGTSSEIQDSGVTVAKTKSQGLLEKYRLSFNTRPTSMLAFEGGGLFERSNYKSETEGNPSDSITTRLRPYARFRLGDNLFNVNGSFSKLQDTSTNSSNLETITLTRDTYSLGLGWVPYALPTLSVRYTLNQSYDDTKTIRDDNSHRLNLSTNFEPFEGLLLNLTENISRGENKLTGAGNASDRLSARLEYTTNLWHDRMHFSSTYNFNRTNSEITRSENGEAEIPIFEVPSGYSSLDDDPETGVMTSNPALVDGDFNVSAKVNLVYQISDFPELRNIGLEFFEDIEINTLRITVLDQSGKLLSNAAALSSAFSWGVYVSEDGAEWTLHETVTDAVFGPFEERFEIRFKTVLSRFIKVVVRPLPATNPIVIDNPDIIVTEIVPVVINKIDDIKLNSTITSHYLDIHNRTQLYATSRRRIFHDFSSSYYSNDRSDNDVIHVRNSVTYFDKLLSNMTLIATALRNDDYSGEYLETGYHWGASLYAVPIRTLTASVAYSGALMMGQEGDSLTHSLNGNTTMKLYEGVDLRLYSGLTSVDNAVGETTTGYSYGLNLGIRPNRFVGFNFEAKRQTSEKNTMNGDVLSTSVYRYRLAASLQPLNSVQLFGSYELVDKDGTVRSAISYSAGWTPFRDGTLTLSLNYNERINPESELMDRYFSPTISWAINKRLHSSLAYSWSDSVSGDRKTETERVSFNLRTNF